MSTEVGQEIEKPGMASQEDYEGEPAGTEGKQGEKKGSFFKELIVYALIVILCVTIVPRYVLQRTEVDGDSMETTLQNEDNLLVEKVCYMFKDPERFDIVTLYPRGRDHTEYYIKRIIGLPGETLQIIGDTIYINGEPLKEDFGREPIEDPGMAAEPVMLGEDEFFVLGDNRNASTDSRSEQEVGIVKKENIDGHAILRIYPFKHFGTLRETVKED